MENELKNSLIYFAIGCAFILGFVLGVISKVQVTDGAMISSGLKTINF